MVERTDNVIRGVFRTLYHASSPSQRRKETHMTKPRVFEKEFADRKLTVEIGKLAGQAHGSCTVRYGDTVVLATAVIAPKERDGVDYFPLTVDYEERLYAAGKIKGSRFIKREGRATDEAVLTARLIDRCVRPLFKGMTYKDLQVIVTVLSVDGENDPDVPAMIAASIALGISPIPWGGPIAGVRIGLVEGALRVNPSYAEREKAILDLFVAGTTDEVVMIEAGGIQVAEKDFYSAVEFGQKQNADLMSFLNDIVREVGVPKRTEAERTDEEKTMDELVQRKLKEFLSGKKLSAVYTKDKIRTKENVAAMKDELDAILKADNEVSKDARAKATAALDTAIEEAARDLVLKTNRRVDGRELDELRELSAEVSVLPRTHGSGLFQRGETQVLSIVTLGSPGDEQTLDTMEESGTKRFMHHYNFPPFSVGEVKPMRGPSRRDIGHGALAEKALVPLIPAKENFPYTIRVVSEVLSSNGSSSQASICGSSLALMDAGVPVAGPCAGIAMGLIMDPSDKKNYRILSDIQGVEDHAGDMDFKVAGTEKGITAAQLDIKLGGISLEIVEKTVTQAREARLKVLATMAKAIAEPRASLSEYAPRIISLNIPVDKIREVIGSGGKIINEIIESCGVEAIDIDDDGFVVITSHSAEGAEKAKAWVESIAKDVELGAVYDGVVTQIVTDRNSGEEIGAIVELGKGKDGMVHISQLRYERIGKVSDVVKVGETIKVKVIDVDTVRGRISLSAKALLTPPANYQGYEDRPRNTSHGANGRPGFNRPPRDRRDRGTRF